MIEICIYSTKKTWNIPDWDIIVTTVSEPVLIFFFKDWYNKELKIVLKFLLSYNKIWKVYVENYLLYLTGVPRSTTIQQMWTKGLWQFFWCDICLWDM